MSEHLAAETLFVTGATGFIGSRLVTELLIQRPHARVIALVQRHDLPRSRALSERWEAAGFDGRVRWIIGDITQENLGLLPEDAQRLAEEVHEIFHLAAFYRLDVTANTAWTVNYLGTKEVAGFATRAPNLRAFHHFSSLVAGGMKPHLRDRPFLNDYERSKYISEVLVREMLGSKVKILNIFRPGVVIGDSQTGETAKFDGLYFCLNFFWQNRTLLRWFPVMMQGSDVNFPVVPVDFVARAAVFLSQRSAAGTHVYPLVEADRVSWPLLYQHFFRRIVGRTPRLLIRPQWIERLSRIPGFENALGFPGASLAYIDFEIPFNVEETQQALQESGIRAPRFWDYADKILEFFLKNADRAGSFSPPTEPQLPLHPGTRAQFPFFEPSSQLDSKRSIALRSIFPERSPA